MDKNKVIINELLCFIGNKFDIVDNDSLVLLCTKAFQHAEIADAKAILKDVCESLDVMGNLRVAGRTGNDKEKRNLDDIIAMMHKLGNLGPTFAAADLKKLPPISFDSIDVTHLLYRLENLETGAKMRLEVEKKTVSTIEKLENELRTLKEASNKTCNLVQTILETSLPSPEVLGNSGTAEPQPRRPKFNGPPPMNPAPHRQGPSPDNGLAPTNPKTSRKPTEKNSNMVSLKMLKQIREVREKTSIKNSTPVLSETTGFRTNEMSSSPPTTLDVPTKYSEILKNGVEIPWQVVDSKAKKQKVIRGTLTNDIDAMAATRRTNLFTSWWRPTVTSEEVRDFLKNRHSLSSECNEVPTKAIKYKCFKISVISTNDIDLFNPDLWPRGVQVSKFYNRPRRTDNVIHNTQISRNRRHSTEG